MSTPPNKDTEAQPLFVQTDKHFVSELPRFLYEGKIVVVVGKSEVDKAVRYLRTAPIIGIDTETRPSFRKGVVHKVALLQVATEQVCFLFRLNMTGFTDSLAALLSDPSVFKVGLSLKDDFLMLRQRRKDFEPGGYVDIQDYVAEMGIKDLSLQKLYANVFHARISKNARLSNWEADVLTEAQKRYAATDAVTCIQLYHRLRELRESGRFRLVQPVPPTDRKIQHEA